MSEENESLEEHIQQEPEPAQYYADFDAAGNIDGFYVDEIHGDNIPESAVPISFEEWQTYSAAASQYTLDNGVVREKSAEELEAERGAQPPPAPTRTEVLEAENADLWYEVMLEKSRNDNHDSEIADLWYETMMGGVSA